MPSANQLQCLMGISYSPCEQQNLDTILPTHTTEPKLMTDIRDHWSHINTNICHNCVVCSHPLVHHLIAISWTMQLSKVPHDPNHHHRQINICCPWVSQGRLTVFLHSTLFWIRVCCIVSLCLKISSHNFVSSLRWFTTLLPPRDFILSTSSHLISLNHYSNMPEPP